MDAFKTCMYQTIGPGGFKCPCCNLGRPSNRGSKKAAKARKIGRRRARRKLKENLKQETEE